MNTNTRIEKFVSPNPIKAQMALNEDFETVNSDKSFSKTKLMKAKINVNGTIKTTQNTVPNVVGLPLRDALYVLENKNFKVKYNGIGKVKSQSITPGKLVENNINIHLNLL